MGNLQEFFKNKKVLITGHTGFKGSWLSQILLLWGAQVSGISLKPSTKPNLYDILEMDGRLTSYITDIRDFKKVKAIIKKESPEIIFHLAAQPLVRESYINPLYTLETNFMGAVNVLEAIRHAGNIKSLVVITSDKVYKNTNTSRPYKETSVLGGHDPYSASKASVELAVASYRKSFFRPENYGNNHQTLISSVRAGNVMGGGDWSEDRVIPDLIRAVFDDGRPVIIRNPRATRPWQHVLQPLSGYLLVAKELFSGNKKVAGAWNFGPNKKSQTSVEKVLSHALVFLGRGSFIVSPDESKNEASLLSLDSSKAHKSLNWNGPLNLEDSIRLTMDWYKNFYAGNDMLKFTNKQIKLFFKSIS